MSLGTSSTFGEPDFFGVDFGKYLAISCIFFFVSPIAIMPYAKTKKASSEPLKVGLALVVFIDFL